MEAISRLDVRDVESVKQFKRRIRRIHETFLRFTHRYWFHEVSTQDLRGELFRAWTGHLGTERLYAEVREEIEDMSNYLDSDSLRRQANTVVRLTVVTTLGLVGTVVTGLLGMNLIAAAEEPWLLKVLYFVLTLVATTLLILFTIVRSKSLAEFLETLADDRVGFGPQGSAPNLGSLFPRVVRWVDICEPPRADAMELKDGLPFDANEVRHSSRQRGECTGRKLLELRRVELLSRADGEGPLHHRHVLHRRVSMRPDAVSVRQPEAHGEGPGLGRISFDDGRLGAGRHAGRPRLPVDLGRQDDDGVRLAPGHRSGRGSLRRRDVRDSDSQGGGEK